MTIIERFKIQSNSDIIYAKTTLSNILKDKEKLDKNFLIFSLMELSTNLIKHANKGEIWILDYKNELLLCALDYGNGIENIDWSMRNGTTCMDNSLGLGLFQMNNNANYEIEICSLAHREMHGTVVLLKPILFNPDIVSLEIPHATEEISGDMFVKKGRFLLLCDGSGHGKKAHKSAELAKSLFYNHPFSCLLVDEFFLNMDKELKEKNMRGLALSIFEISKGNIQVCGIGNISFWIQHGDSYKYASQKDGILGEHYSSSDKFFFELSHNQKFITATDGIDVGKFNNLLLHMPKESSSTLIALSAIHFASVTYDDKTIVVITTKKE